MVPGTTYDSGVLTGLWQFYANSEMEHMQIWVCTSGHSPPRRAVLTTLDWLHLLCETRHHHLHTLIIMNMTAFAIPSFLQTHPYHNTPKLSRSTTVRIRAALRPPQEPTKPRFLRDADDPSIQTQTSFFPEKSQQQTSQTPNKRVLQQVRDTMQRLGVEEHPQTPSPRPFSPIDISSVNPFSPLVGAFGAAFISYAVWSALGYIAFFFASHPLDDQIYVVQRLSAVVRTGLVCLFALGSGISGVTSLGLFLLFGRTAYGTLSGEFRNSNAPQNRSQSDVVRK
ncbi:hypothetical protein BWQ96_03629 [Gracilariopsis chorda]|uniref:Uncharacterized protein n=1 Tax=Gracilariopsis chorda TaxID=448386 RepID=A0A2V3IZV8_9FLOR|nr:hypothetical protein BWQ96_03629 [Gracilariopsis chorda]|eukprot:PXF46640.1 hypothetical protein BWQ96_03629 [Gracilariopsis chorda]